jgi:aminoglycoside phosphotransferase (APT) family kinase protein
VYLYREEATSWTMVAKFYAVKTGEDAPRHARRELHSLQRAMKALSHESGLRAARPVAVWRGVLFQGYVDGLSLEDSIAVRRTRPGELLLCLERTARLLATLHARSVEPDIAPDQRPAESYARKVVEDLARWGVLQGNSIVVDGLQRLIARRCAHPSMANYVPTAVHGDATTSNFLFPPGGGVVALDWERLHVADPASDLGRLMAEVSHSITRHGGDVAEALFFVQSLTGAYCAALPATWDAERLIARAGFFQASSTLRIARNGWVPRLDRLELVAQALALLA